MIEDYKIKPMVGGGRGEKNPSSRNLMLEQND